MANASSVTVDPNVGWSVDHRGYIHGGFDTPVFQASKQKHNSRLTSRRNKGKKSSQYGKTLQDAKEMS